MARDQVDFAMRLTIRFDNGLSVPWVRRIDGILSAIAGPNALSLFAAVPTHGENLSTVAEFRVAVAARAVRKPQTMR